MFRRIFAVIYKEFLQIIRDPVAFSLLIALPVFILFIFGYAINLDIRHIPMGVLDLDKTVNSRALLDRFVNSGYFTLKRQLYSEKQMTKLLDRGDVKVIIKIPTNFQRDVFKGKSTPVQILIDGTDNNTANVVMSYVQTIIQEYSNSVLFELLRNNPGTINSEMPSLDVRPNIWYNPELTSVNFMVPGIIGIIMMVVGVIRMSISIVREKEMGTMECLMVSSLRPFELMLGKITPYIFIAFIDLILIVLFGQYVFGVPFRGSFLLFLLLSFIFLGAALGMGLFISSIAKTSQVAWLAGFLATILPSIILSGFIFPISNMPQPVQLVSYLVPARYFLIILRGIILKGVGISVLYPQAVILFVFALLMIIISSMRFKKRID
jgi:ABC-2 type transport system permease protein